MKKIVFLLVIFITALISSCNKDSLTADGSNDTSTNPTLLSNLQKYNENLPLVRAGRPSKGDWFGIAGSDILGAYHGAKAGAYFGAVFGPHGATAGSMICGLICGVGASYTAYDHITRSQTENTDSLQTSIISIYSHTNEIESLAENNTTEISISYDTHYDSISAKVAILHNIILDELQNPELTLEEIDLNALTPIESSIIESTEFQQFFNSNLSEIMTEQSLTDALSDNIIKLFFQALKDSAFDAASVNEIVNDYISIIENDNTMTTQEKEILYTAFSVACYSAVYWEDYYNNNDE